MAGVPITVLPYNGPLFFDFNVRLNRDSDEDEVVP